MGNFGLESGSGRESAVILSGIGWVRSYQVHQVGNRELPPAHLFVKHRLARPTS
jgi:hypothetical protein